MEQSPQFGSKKNQLEVYHEDARIKLKPLYPLYEECPDTRRLQHLIVYWK